MKRRASNKLDELLQLCSTLKHELLSVRQQLKKQRQQNRRSSNLIKELHQFLIKDQGCRSLQSRAASTIQRRLELSFVCGLPTRLFTATKIYAVDDSTGSNVSVRVVLLDESSEVVTDGPLSSLKIEIVVCYGDVKAEESEASTGKEVLEMRRVSAQEEKGTLIVGSCREIMENGVCCFNDLKFVDNSSWVPSRTFKLVAKVVENDQVPEMMEIRPAVSRPFQVMDQRGKQYEKQLVPSWDGQVWRLKKIRRNGPYHRKLEEHGIRTVMDFRRRYAIDQSSLRKILGAKDGVWAAIVEHANDCCPNRELLFRYDSEEGVELLFNCFYNLIAVSFDHQNERSLENLSQLEKNLVEQVRRRAIEDDGKLIQINSISGWPSTKSTPWIAQDPPVHQGDTTLNELSFGCESFPQSPLWFSAEYMHRLEEPTVQRIAEIEGFSTVESGCILWNSFSGSH